MHRRDKRTFNYRRFYDSIASVYGLGIRLLPIWQSYILQAIPWLPDHGAILEIGPGPGWLLQKLTQQYPMVVGLDLSLAMLKQCKQRLSRTGETARLVRGNAINLPFVANSFDGIISTFAFSAIPDGGRAMNEMTRVLRPNGFVSLVDACVPEDGNPAGRALARIWELFGDYMRDEADLMRRAGLQVVERREFGAFGSIRLVVGHKVIGP